MACKTSGVEELLEIERKVIALFLLPQLTLAIQVLRTRLSKRFLNKINIQKMLNQKSSYFQDYSVIFD